MQSRNVPTYLPQAILTTVFCCLPFGIVAIVYDLSLLPLTSKLPSELIAIL
ncbi:CD225/dispanin family protein [Fischerella thermalis]|jgi:hypothetical protein|uniref:CD225/dispanin family protein n=1 Tax=Fischerella thermalis TaxID=372787 RepID=UPI00215578CD|nr:CD225/dispanin family protein [Fischerella thermalis]